MQLWMFLRPKFAMRGRGLESRSPIVVNLSVYIGGDARISERSGVKSRMTTAQLLIPFDVWPEIAVRGSVSSAPFSNLGVWSAKWKVSAAQLNTIGT